MCVCELSMFQAWFPWLQAQERKKRLDDSYFLHHFLSDFRDLVSWVHDMKAIISADELAKDVAGAEALLERHQEHKVCDATRFRC